MWAPDGETVGTSKRECKKVLLGTLIERSGNIFKSNCDAIAITVNCQGVMGAGIALEARLRWPTMFEAYREQCEQDGLRPGGVFWWTPDRDDQPVVACVATKGSWRLPSRLEWVKGCLEGIASGFPEQGVESLALPRLGTSHGGLDWGRVRPWVHQVLEPVKLDVEVWDFDPRAEDPWFEELRVSLSGRTPREVSGMLGVSPAAAQTVMKVVGSPHTRSLYDLQGARGIGEKTLTSIYRYIFPEGGKREEQEKLWD